MNAELKYSDIASATYLADTTGSVVCLNAIAQGDDNTNRDGRQVCNKSIHLHGLLTPASNATLPNYARLMLIWDAQPNSAAAVPSVGDILVAGTSISNTNLNNRHRFTIIRDLKLPQGDINVWGAGVDAYSNGNNTHVVDIFVTLEDVITTYSGTTATVASIATGSLLLLTIGSQATGGAGGLFQLTSRLRFYD